MTINKRMAKVMGWETDYHREPFPYHRKWYFKDVNSIMPTSDWNPKENIEQAMMCLEKLKSQEYYVILHNPVIVNWRCKIFYGEEEWEAESNIPAEAICQAIDRSIGGSD